VTLIERGFQEVDVLTKVIQSIRLADKHGANLNVHLCAFGSTKEAWAPRMASKVWCLSVFAV
jgi:hypothetical protein